jgi:hypothetical protein
LAPARLRWNGGGVRPEFADWQGADWQIDWQIEKSAGASNLTICESANLRILFRYNSLNATGMGSLAARMAGKSPPTRPISSA